MQTLSNIGLIQGKSFDISSDTATQPRFQFDFFTFNINRFSYDFWYNTEEEVAKGGCIVYIVEKMKFNS